ncbi:MAG: helix-turn-helix transcriptional regulator [Myxococcales bacterium]|nr:helix-turn-helix transcriptional regulator [Myxococcales bacterium]
MGRASVSTHGILNPRAAARRFTLTRVAPSPALASLVERHWIIRWSLPAGESHAQETLPHPCVNLVVEADRCAVHGPATARHVARLTGSGRVVATKFKPGGFSPLVDFPVRALSEGSRALADAFGLARDELAPAVRAEPDDAAAVALVERFLEGRARPPDAAVALVIEAATLALERRDLVTVERLAAAVGVSPRTLQRLFERHVGVSPKWMLRRYRVHELAARVERGEPLRWASLAAELGYCDQSHLIREFKAQLGRSPTEYAAWCAGRS